MIVRRLTDTDGEFCGAGQCVIGLTTGSCDDPSRFASHHNVSAATRLVPWVDTAHPPGYRLDEHMNVVEQWKKAIGEYPG